MHYCNLLLAIASCIQTISATIDLEEAVDLSWHFNNDTVYWSHTVPYVFSKRLTEVRTDGVWRESNEFCAGEHGGTYFNAPSRFYRRGWKVGEIPLSRLIVQGILIDLLAETEQQYEQARLLPKHLEEWEARNGDMPDSCVVLIRFGWAKYYSNKLLYLGIDSDNGLNYPGMSHSAADWIAKSRKVVGVGIDTASVDPGRVPNFPAQQLLSENQIYVMENINIPAEFPETNFTLYVMPTKLEIGNGAPLRIIAVPSQPKNIPSIPWYSHTVVAISGTILYMLYLPFSLE